MQVAMRHLETSNDETNAFAVELGVQRTTDSAGDRHEMRGSRIVQCGPMIDFGTRDDQTVAGRDRIDRQEDDAAIVGVGNVTRQVAVHDSCEDARHDAKLASRPLGTVLTCAS